MVRGKYSLILTIQKTDILQFLSRFLWISWIFFPIRITFGLRALPVKQLWVLGPEKQIDLGFTPRMLERIKE